jgi:GT2 family glycosyltransferase
VADNFSGALVLYNNDRETILRAVKSFLEGSESASLYIVDNSPKEDLKDLFKDERIIYLHNPTNPGFGASHNIAINLSIKAGNDYHFVVNPDVYFDRDVIIRMVDYMKSDQTVGMMMPEVLNTDGSVQFLPKLLPNPFWIFKRKFLKTVKVNSDFINNYELRNIPKSKVYNAPILSGCFSLLNLQAVKEVGGYDDRFFLYFEDFDLSRRIHAKYKTIYYPLVSIFHAYESGANKKIKLFKIFIASAICYFNKWGWVFDGERKRINKKVLEQF